jgi:ribulose-phosphate 3-epimerase
LTAIAAPGRGLLLRLLSGGPRVTVGMLTADFARLGDELEILEREGVELVHVDVMDGAFCPMLTVGPPIVKAMRTSMIKDIHLMVDDPLSKIESFIAAGADMITFHVEGASQPHRVLQVLRGASNANDPERGLVCGIGINPSTPVTVVEPLLDEVDYILVLAVNPGWEGQTFSASTETRVRQVRELIEKAGRPILLGIDGGVTKNNVKHVLAMGADIVVTGSAVFDGKAAAENARFMLTQARSVHSAL